MYKLLIILLIITTIGCASESNTSVFSPTFSTWTIHYESIIVSVDEIKKISSDDDGSVISFKDDSWCHVQENPNQVMIKINTGEKFITLTEITYREDRPI